VKTSELHSLAGTPIRFRVIGLCMLPMTLGHLETLERLGVLNPCNVSELSLAALVCAIPWDKFQRFTTSLWLRPALWLWGRTVRQWSFEEELGAFRAYVGHSMSCPPVSPVFGDTSTGVRSDVPFSRYLRVILCSRLGYRPETVRDCPLQDALWDHATLAEIAGRGKVESAPYEERVAEMEAMMPPDDVMIAAAMAAGGKR
jgi:hypothetical protein